MTAPVISALPTPVPQRSSPGSFAARGDALLAALPGFVDEANAVAAYLAEMADLTATYDALTNFKGAWSGLTGALAMPATVSHSGNIYALTANVADVTAHTPGVSASWQLVRANTTQITHGAGTASDALSSLFATARNKVLNGNFAGNVRGLTGSVTLGASARGHDCWQAGASGCTMTGASGPPTITAGSYKTTVDGALIVQTGNHVVSWPGTATCSVNGAPAAASPIAVSLTAGSNVSLEFGVGTIGEVQLEEGVKPTRIAHLPKPLQRHALNYYVRFEPVMIGNGNAVPWASARSTTTLYRPYTGSYSMRLSPSITPVKNTAVEYLNASGVWTATTISMFVIGSSDGFFFAASATGDGSGTGVMLRRNAVENVSAILSAEI